MILNYIKIAWRNLNKHRFFSLINICGLAIGVATFWMIALYVADEWSFDRYNEKADRIFRVVQHGKWGNGKFDLAVTSIPYAAALKADNPEVNEAISIESEGGGKITYNEKQINADNILFASKGIFNIFSYHFLEGNPNTALAEPHSIVLTKTLAQTIFGDISSAVGKTIYFDKDLPNTVTAVIDDVPVNSHFTFSGLRSFNAGYTTTWGNASAYTYILTRDAADGKRIEARSPQFFNKYLKDAFAGVNYRMELQPLTSIHLHSALDYEMGSNGNIMYVYIFSIVGLLILGIAVINYVNLTTARCSVRVKEIGIRKVIGSGRSQLMLQFFAESVMLTALATVLGLVIIRSVLPFFNNLSGKNLSLWYFGYVKSIAVFAGFALLTGLISGLYPALLLSGFRVIPAMKGQMGSQTSTVLFRKSLVTFQFVITIVMIAGSCIIYQQLHYVMNRDLGFNRSQMLTFHISKRDVRKKVAAIKTELLQNPLIESVAVAGNPIGNNDIGSNDFNLGPDGKTTADTKLVESLIIDEDFIPAMQIKIAAGRNFMKASSDTTQNAIIVNQTLVNELGWKNPVGMRVRTGVDSGKVIYSTIVGVIKDFNTYSLQHKIAPMVLNLPKTADDGDNFYVRLSPKKIPQSLEYLKQVYARFDAENKVNYHFLDQNFAAQYRGEQTQGQLLLIFTIVAISIASLGLLGLVTFTAEQRVKEIGIRKVLGAGVFTITRLLTTDLIKLVLIAILIAAPLAWWAMSKWLQGFAYRVGISWWVFLAAGVGAVAIAVITMSYQSIKAALANPVKSLRSE